MCKRWRGVIRRRGSSSDVQGAWKSWPWQLDEINLTEMRIELIPDAKPFKSTKFSAGSKTVELERADVYKQLKEAVIEPAIWMGQNSTVCTEKGQGTLLYPLQEAQIDDRQGYESFTKNESVHRQTRWSAIIHNAWRIFELLANEHTPKWTT